MEIAEVPAAVAVTAGLRGALAIRPLHRPRKVIVGVMEGQQGSGQTLALAVVAAQEPLAELVMALTLVRVAMEPHHQFLEAALLTLAVAVVRLTLLELVAQAAQAAAVLQITRQDQERLTRAAAAQEHTAQPHKVLVPAALVSSFSRSTSHENLSTHGH